MFLDFHSLLYSIITILVGRSVVSQHGQWQWASEEQCRSDTDTKVSSALYRLLSSTLPLYVGTWHTWYSRIPKSRLRYIVSSTILSRALYRLSSYIVSSTILSRAIYCPLLCAIVCWYTWHMWCMIYLALILNSNLQIWCNVEWLGTFCEIHYTLYQVWKDISVW